MTTPPWWMEKIMVYYHIASCRPSHVIPPHRAAPCRPSHIIPPHHIAPCRVIPLLTYVHSTPCSLPPSHEEAVSSPQVLEAFGIDRPTRPLRPLPSSPSSYQAFLILILFNGCCNHHTFWSGIYVLPSH